ncbi:MAG: protein gvpG [Halobacteriales archaeon SW_9_67_24]|jgi:lipid A disaccharide synthetase|nr:MAG: protein gvpG [Halobacteriales archaeon SW_9_67_24]
MFVVDDLLVRPFVSLLNVVHTMAIEEFYDTEAIRDDIKENRLLFEIDERSREAYEERRAELERQLDVAEQARENLQGKVEIKR